MARPKHRTAPSVALAARVEPEVAEAIDAIAAEKGVNRAQAVRLILEEHVTAKKKPAQGRH